MFSVLRDHSLSIRSQINQTDFKEFKCGQVNWINLQLEQGQRRVILREIMTIRFVYLGGGFLGKLKDYQEIFDMI
jgi:hypothetical protein